MHRLLHRASTAPTRSTRPGAVVDDRRRRLRARGADQAPLRLAPRSTRPPSPTRSRTSGSATASPCTTWKDIWLNEGWADVVGVDLGLRGERWRPARRSSSTTQRTRPAPSGTRRPPTRPRPALFDTFPVYTRPAMMLAGAARDHRRRRASSTSRGTGTTSTEHGHGTTAQFIVLAKQTSGFSGADLTKLDTFFQQWLFGTTHADDHRRQLLLGGAAPCGRHDHAQRAARARRSFAGRSREVLAVGVDLEVAVGASPRPWRRGGPSTSSSSTWVPLKTFGRLARKRRLPVVPAHHDVEAARRRARRPGR